MPCIITPTMNIRVGTVTAGGAAAVEVVNEGTPNNADWVINMTLPAVGDNSVDTQQIVDGAITAAKIAAGAITGAQIAANSVPISVLSDLPTSAKKQLYAHYIAVNVPEASGRTSVHGWLYFVDSISEPVVDFATLKQHIKGSAVTVGSYYDLNNNEPMVVDRTIPVGEDIVLGARNFMQTRAPSISLSTEGALFNDTVVLLGSNAG